MGSETVPSPTVFLTLRALLGFFSTSGWQWPEGMLLPTEMPELTPEVLASWRGTSYPVVCYNLLRMFVAQDEMTDAELHTVVDASFTCFGIPEVVRIKPLHVVGAGLVSVCELWHGPTLAFKDLGMQVLAKLLQHFLKKRERRLTVLVGTSGDTGAHAREDASPPMSPG